MEDHDALEATLADLAIRAHGGDWKDLDEVWSDFAMDLEQHLTFEERELLPAFAALGPDAKRVAKELKDEHKEIRRLCEDLGIRIQLHEVRAAAIDEFVTLLRSHADKEDQTLYPWVDSRPR